MTNSISHTTLPAPRVCQAYARWPPPLKIKSQPTNIFTASPAASGNAMARKPATIIMMLSPMDHPKDLLAIIGIGMALMASPSLDALYDHVRRSHRDHNYFGGKSLNSLSTAFSSFFVSFDGFSERVSV